MIQMGLSTHTHDHAMYPASFSPMNRSVNIPANPMPLLLLDELLPMISFLLVDGRCPWWGRPPGIAPYP